MNVCVIRCLLPLLFASLGVATSLNANNETEIIDDRQPRVTGRIVKLYSGSKSEPIQCTEEGFQGDPLNCAIFYRCIKSAQGKFTIFRFQCGPGTIYDPDTEVCNHPKSTKRSECYDILERSSAIKVSAENDIDNDVPHELPSPIDLNRVTEQTTAKLLINSILPSASTPSRITLPPLLSNRVKLSSTTTKSVLPKSSQQEGDTCTEDGFMGDSENCRKFYRCVANVRGGFIRYEFSCSESTVWDDDTQGCNHPWSVKRRRCGRDTGVTGTKEPSQNSDNNDSEPDASTIQEQIQINYGNRVTQLQLQINNGTKVKQNQTQINYADNVKQKQKQENYAPSSQQAQKQVSHGSAVSQSQKQVNYGDKSTQVQIQIDHTKQSSQAQQQTFLPPEPATKPQAASNGDNYENKCSQSGFMGDSKDCRKFYRCVDNGKGSYTRYEFSCGDGTVWDQNIEACNHAWAVKDCGGKPQPDSSQSESSSTTTTTTKPMQTTLKPVPTDDGDDEPSYGNQNQDLPSSTETAKEPEHKPQSTTEGTSEPSSDDVNVCKSSGFVGDAKDCKKFYRCVDNGNGKFTRYEFSCGEGTVWDQRIEGCNHAWAVDKCGGISTEEYEKVEATTKKEMQSQTTQSSVTHDDASDTGYGPSQEETTSAPVSTTRRPPEQEISKGNECRSSGFMGDDNDCKKFYRCVDNGNGGYTRYEFSCGEGTVWDPSIEACNHAWAVKKCGGSESLDTQIQTESTHTQDTTKTTTESTGSVTEEPNEDQGYNQPHAESESDSTTTKSPPESNEECTQEGFMGDRRDCKKFYRCVDNGKGGFTKYEFTCGEGTVWDQEIQACNHPPSNKKCGGTSSSQSQTTKEPKPDNDDSYTESTEKTTTESSKTTEASNEQKPKPSKDTCESEGFYGDSNDCKKFYRCVENGKGSYTKYDFTCGDGTVWDQEIQGCNHDTGKCKQGSPSSTTESSQEASTKHQDENGPTTQSSGTTTTTEKISSSSLPGDKCTSEGFYANSQDCKKFYRCVDNGKGGYTKYDFSCGEGTVWVQELQACDHDSDDSTCKSQSNQNSEGGTQPTSEKPDQQQSTSTTQSQTQSDESSNDSTSKPSSDDENCSSEGFYPNKNDCKKFYRCVDNGHGGYTKYDFTCGEGTAWDSDIQACNHISEVKSCDGSSSQSGSDSQSGQNDESTESTTKTSTSGPSTESSKPSHSKDSCTEEGFFGNKDDCKKFYRCVDNGKGGYTKYDFTCGEGTIWDQDITACNHPGDVSNPSCSDNESQSESSSSSTTEGSSQGTSSTTEKTQESSNCTQDESSKKPSKGNITCDKEGFHENPNDCKKFYRCVDWDGDGKKFSVFHFECGEGTIWDPALDTCNYEDSVYPRRDCSGTQSQNENVDEQTTTKGTTTTTTEGTTTTTTKGTTTTTTEGTTTTKEPTTTTESTTTQQTTTEESTTQSSTTEKSTTEKSTTQKSTTSEQTTTQESTTSEQTTTQESTTSEQTTTQQTTTSEETTTQQSTTSEGTTSEQTTTTQESTTNEQTTQSSTTQETTTQESTTSEQTTTQESTTTEGTTESSTTQESTTQDSTEQSSESTTESSTEGTTEQSDQTTTESSDDQTTTEQSSESEKECPETDDDQYLYVCPTGFKRHPKYCDMFYQCSEDDDTHEVKVATFNCPNNTIYDESKTQCVEEDKADKKCDGQKAQKRRFKRLDLNTKSPIVVSKQKHNCLAAGHFPFEKDEECSPAFLKCEKLKSGKLRGMVHRCPEGYVYWSVSRRCEPKSYLKNCKHSANDWSGRWEIPLERRNIAT